MDERDHETLGDAELDAALEAEARELAADVEVMEPAIALAIIPFGLVVLFLAAVLGEWVWKGLPLLLVGFLAGLKLWIAWRKRVDSSLPLVLPGVGRVTGARKRRLAAGGAVLMTLAVVAAFALDTALGWGLGVLRDWLVDWRVPWPF